MNKFSLEHSKSPGLYHNRNASYDGLSISRQDMSRLSILSPKNFYESPDNSFYGATPMNAGMSARNSPLQMFSTLQNFHKQPLTAKAGSLNRKELETLLYEYKGSGLSSVIQKEKKGAPDTARIEAYFKIDYGNSGHKKDPNNDVEDVKRLDEWQMALKRQQVMGNIVKPNELLEQHQRREVKNRERDDFPKVKQELFDRIAANSDDEEEGKKMFQKERLPALLKDSKSLIGGAIGDFINDGFKNGAISLEVVQRENNKEILGDLINKKIKEEMKTIKVGAMSDEQLRIHVKKVAEKVVVQFKTLKGPAGSLIVHNCVESTLKLLKLKRHDPEGFAAEFQKPSKNAENEVIADYEMMEDLLMEKFELCESDTEDLRSKVKDLTIESYNIKKDLIALQAQLDAIEKKSVKALGDTAARDINRTSIKLMPTTNGRRASVKKSSNSKLAVSKLEKHSEVLELSKKVHDAREKLVLKQQELQLQENELENIRGQMDYYKTQLRGLYYKCLKDDAALLRDSKNKKSYAWVIRSLWRIKEEVKDQAFPGYLDATSIKYLIDYAKAQNDLEEFCKQNNILNLVSNAEDLKVLNKKLDSGLPQETADDTTWTADNFDLMKLPRPQIKDLNTLLGDVHNQMAAFKRINLKAKRQVPIGRHGFKAKSIAYKWEDVDPTDMDKVLTFQDQAVSTFEGTEVHKIKKTNHVEDHNKIVWDQGMEKLKAIFAMQKKELDRLIKLSLGKELDDRLRSSLQKALLFLFGRLGQESFIRFLREKTAYDQNVQGKAKKASLSSGVVFLNKPFSTSVPGSPTSISPSPQTNQFGNTFGSSMYQGEPLGYSNAMSRVNSTQADQQGFKTTKDSFAKFAMRTSSIGEMRTIGGWKP